MKELWVTFLGRRQFANGPVVHVRDDDTATAQEIELDRHARWLLAYLVLHPGEQRRKAIVAQGHMGETTFDNARRLLLSELDLAGVPDAIRADHGRLTAHDVRGDVLEITEAIEGKDAQRAHELIADARSRGGQTIAEPFGSWQVASSGTRHQSWAERLTQAFESYNREMGGPRPPVSASIESAGERTLNWERLWAGVAQLGQQIFRDRAYGGFRPDIVVGVNHGGAIIAGLLYYDKERSFPIATVAAGHDGTISSPEHLTSTLDVTARVQGRAARILLVDDSTKNGDSLDLAKQILGQTLAAYQFELRTAVIVFRGDLRRPDIPPPDFYVYTEIDAFPYGPV